MIRLSYNTSTIKRFITVKNPVEKIISKFGTSLKYGDGTVSAGTCIVCNSKYCARYQATELYTPTFRAFPHNTNDRVCPTNAISSSLVDGRAIISSEDCIGCGLCLHRCPTAAISFNFRTGKASVNFDETILKESDIETQSQYITLANSTNCRIDIGKIPVSFFNSYESLLLSASKKYSDISEIVVRNTLLNMGIPCNVNAAGNNHIRTEFFGEEDGNIIMGESDIKNSDTLAIPRRILDDVAVLVSRYGMDKDKIVPLSVINGLPNKRTDYYEVVYDVCQILGIQIYTITYHILWLLNFYNIEFSISNFKSFIIDKNNQDLLPALEMHIQSIASIDGCCNGCNYKPNK